ncbi:glycosyltransferase family 2 protein [Reichenbachiella carrageenanivorans]|uniref:Glycosyltransferase family 2 protein n=1 Tax=Reichenbachiella carrageenanivorans TaxID=2979869 RepID=A0ABY6D148_9BACT|nr:cellulose synthase family protein [Reichenbachiella carrageenanivorans]UXX78798.1 glycosyltransferase family 2 protein [Reichenbachiella carrageenanivorans]
MEWIIVVLYCVALLAIFLFSLGQLHLTWIYTRPTSAKSKDFDEAYEPLVTVQLPIYNERYVAERLIDAVVKLDYPKDKLEIQILDDSNDETVALIAQKVAEYQAQGFDIQQIQREDRKGFKAGALAFGLKICKGEYTAIFDSDFLPNPDFIKRTIGYFANEKVGMVQTRWGHVNKDYSMLTEMQAFGLDAHFTVEQGGRNRSGSFMNFNGTAGIWRKACVLDAGGWSADTLTEDLDLSYRAQLRGWQFQFDESVESPAELPVEMSAIKSQQYRWNKGAAETAKKNLLNVFRAKVSLKTKIHAAMHLLNSSVFVLLLTASVLSIPMLYIKAANGNLQWLFNLGSLFLIGFFSIAAFYFVGLKRIAPTHTKRLFLRKFPLFLSFSMGFALHNAIAVMEGYLGFKSPFVRTPKFNITKKTEGWTSNQYIKPKLTWGTIFEGLLCAYFVWGIFSAWLLNDYGLILFHVMLAIGFGVIFYHSLKHIKNA